MPLRTLSYRSLWLGLALIFSACMGFNRDSADFAGERDDAIEKQRRWRKSLPRCFPWKYGLREDWPASGKVKKLRGVLYPSVSSCTLMGCDCCNGCDGDFSFIPRAEMIRHGKSGKSRPIILAGESYPMGYSARDCEIASIRRMPLLEVVVSGRLDDENGSTVVDAKLCVLGELPLDSLRAPVERAWHH
jgi:hypothetical protein